MKSFHKTYFNIKRFGSQYYPHASANDRTKVLYGPSGKALIEASNINYSWWAKLVKELNRELEAFKKAK